MSLLKKFASAVTSLGGINFSMRFKETGYKNMRNLPKLLTAILKTYERPEYAPKISADGNIVETYCNFAARDIAGYLGYHRLAGKNADQLFLFLKTSEEWREVEMTDAQFLANQGTLVFAVMPSSELRGGHGHICVIRPGEEIHSTKWNCKVPAVMNVGGQNYILRFKTKDGACIDAGVNGAFREIPKFYAWVDSL